MSDPLHSIDTGLLRSFAVVAETRNFTRAAERLNVVQSAVSMQIKRLETALDVRLLDRSNREVKLTAQGELVLRYAHRVMRLTDETLAQIGRRPTSGRVRLAATDLSICYLPKALQAFKIEHPLIEIELSCDRSWEALAALEAGEADVAFVTQPCGREGGRVLGEAPLVWATAKGSDVAALDPLPLALFAPGCIYRQAAIDALERDGRPYRLAYESQSRAGLDCVVGAGLAITIAPMDYVGGGLRALAPAEEGLPELPALKTYLFSAVSKRTAAMRAFTDVMIATLGRE